MYSVFSQSLINCYVYSWQAQNRKQYPKEFINNLKLKQVLTWIKNKGIDDIPQILYCNELESLNDVIEEARYKTCFEKIRKLSKWITKNIILEIQKDNMQTMNVKIRIAVDMMNKIENEEFISKQIALVYFNNIVTNVRQLKIDLDLEDLPFQN